MNNTPTPKELSDFAGHWRFTRDVLHGDGSSMQVTGVAQFEWQGDDLAYLERGEMQLPSGPPLRTERRYLWQRGMQVHFADGRFFHSVPPLGGKAAHWCAPDDYRVSYDFELWPLWRSVWQVHGPAKDYVMTTTFTR
ncbi:hypothetical protein GGR95_003025 [Sulfitobacter undariae]|uniref:DUF6314 domain-containing protein n=1 Tax=Sulfitobacter undariae TaxID=1563671 RepID=A0A7W6EB63_9RHOB|nr:DUF6314 family protein [Sulfitobacter undariae]MBB3995370.1 hypothetical protein [Sulfitobacter undariae]